MSTDKDAEIATLKACVLKLQDSLVAAKRHELAGTLTPPAADAPIYWLEAEESARGQDPREVFGKYSMLYSTRMSPTKPIGNNPCWPLYLHPAAAPAPIQSARQWDEFGRTNSSDETGGTVQRFGFDCTKLPVQIIPATNGGFVYFDDYLKIFRALAAPAAAPAPASSDEFAKAMKTARHVYAGMQMPIECLDYLQALLDNPLPDFEPDEQPEQVKPTDISKRLRECAKWDASDMITSKDLNAAADEIERYYGGMLAWKQTAETKDMALSEEMTRKVNVRVAERLAQEAKPTDQARELTDALRDAMAEQLSTLYHCGRCWSAWGVGTMTQDDFSVASDDDDIIANFVEAARTAILAAPQAGKD